MIKWKMIFCGVLIIILGLVIFIDIKADYNKCVRILVNEDYIENGCDKYFIGDKWYKEYTKQMFDEYDKIK